MLFPK
jgi:hypothetical protein